MTRQILSAAWIILLTASCLLSQSSYNSPETGEKVLGSFNRRG